MTEYSKCRFCKWYDDYEGCENICYEHDQYKPNSHKLITKAKEQNISVSDVVLLIEMEDN